METQPPKSIRTIGLVLAIIGAFLFLGNGFSALFIGVFDFPGRFARQIPAGQELPFDVFGLMRAMVPLAAASAGLGLALAIGGLYVRQYQRWALYLTNAALIAYIALLWYLPSYLRPYLQEFFDGLQQVDPHVPHFGSFVQLGQYFNALFWSAPLGAALYLLNRKNTRPFFN
ncbi:hypothetical protein [Flaviaesturariibacter terrae]